MARMLKQFTLGSLLALTMFASVPAFAGRTDWREMTVGHFHLFSTLKDSSTRDVARELQAFENTVGGLIRRDERLPDVPTLIYILDNSDFLRYAAGRSGLAGIFFERPFANLIVINGDLPFGLVRVSVFHEYTHFMQRNSTTAKLPPWYMEGYAMLFSSFRLEKQKITLGTLPVGVHVNMQQWIPVGRLLAVNQSDPEYRAERLAGEFYGESWALVHLLLFDDPSLAIPTAAYLRDLDDGFPQAEALRRFPFDEQKLDHMLHDFVTGRKIRIRVYNYLQEISVEEAPITRMTAAQADAALLRLLFMLGDREDLIAPLASKTLKENPAEPAILALTARIAVRQKHLADVGRLASALSKGGTSDPQLRIDVADAILAPVESGAAPDPTAAAEAVLAILGDLVQTEEPPVEAVVLWAAAGRAADADQEKVIPVLERASARAPHNTEVLRGLAFASEALGDKSRARAYYNRIILMSEYPAERLWAQKEADSPRLR
jgi:hypothetical protein